jgi:hypothetical protein
MTEMGGQTNSLFSHREMMTDGAFFVLDAYHYRRRNCIDGTKKVSHLMARRG